jgi:hypothetical protein
VRYHEPTSGIVFLIISISSDMPQESGTIVTVHRRPILLHSVHIYSVNQMRHNLSDIAFSATLRTSSPYPQSYVGVSLGRRVCIVELSSISTTCGLYYDHLRSLIPLIHNGEPLFMNSVVSK